MCRCLKADDGCAYEGTLAAVISNQMCLGQGEKFHTGCQDESAFRGDTGVGPRTAERNKLCGVRTMLAGGDRGGQVSYPNHVLINSF